MRSHKFRGLLAIGDPHLASRVPGFRKDEYPRTILRKLNWCLDYAREHSLVPCLLGDVFHWPRDNANWLLGEFFDLLTEDVLAVFGNHDCGENTLGDDDSLSVIAKAGRLRLIDRTGPWRGVMNGRPVVIGGTSWGQPLPESFRADNAADESSGRAESLVVRPSLVDGLKPEAQAKEIAFSPSLALQASTTVSRNLKIDEALAAPLVFWLVHHDVRFPGYEDAGHFEPHEIQGIDVIINGHIHRSLADVVAGRTTWLNPGNIARVKRGDSTRDFVPRVLRIDVDRAGWHATPVEVPHEPFEQVFHAEIMAESIATDDSAFVQGLAELVTRRTEGGAGLMEFLEQNLPRFDERVAHEIRILANEVIEDAKR